MGSRVYGFQFHPEVPEGELPAWLASEPRLPYGAEDGVQSREEILEGGRRFGQGMERLARQLVGRFLLLISMKPTA
jgi:hypothetical protein